MAPDILSEDVEDLSHGSSLLGFAGHGQENRTKRKRPELNVLGVGEDALDVGWSVPFVEAGVDEANDCTGGFGMKPGCR